MAFLSDGYQTLITIVGFPNILLRERELQPPALDAGGPIDTTTMRNGTPGIPGSGWRSAWPKSLISMGEVTIQCQWDPAVYAVIANSILHRILNYRITFPDANNLNFLGFMDKFTPSSHKFDDFPLAEVKIVPSLQGASGGPISVPFVDQGGSMLG